MEVNILHSLGFELQRLDNAPHKFLLTFLQNLKVEKVLTQKAIGFANDCYLGRASIHYPPELLAFACIYLAYKTTPSEPMPREPWWIMAEFPFEKVEEVAKEIYKVHELGVPEYHDCRRIIEKLGHQSNKEYHYFLSFDRMYKLSDTQVKQVDEHGQNGSKHKDGHLERSKNYRARSRSREDPYKKTKNHKKHDQKHRRDGDRKHGKKEKVKKRRRSEDTSEESSR